jgi:acetolactate decarboxylase
MRTMRCKLVLRLVLMMLMLLAVGWQSVAQGPSVLYIYSTIDALLAGTYDGDLTIRELAVKGDFGIGTYSRLDGEMLALDGVFYHARADGSVTVADPKETTPLAYVTRFHPVHSFSSRAALSMPELEAWMDNCLQNPNLFYAIRIDGTFRDLSVRALAPQNKPYKPLAEIVHTQSIHDYPTIRGTLIGIRSPAFSKGISVPGYHWHFLSEERRRGGHVLKMTMIEGRAKAEVIAKVDLELPRSEAFAKADQSKDRSGETKLVEGK